MNYIFRILCRMRYGKPDYMLKAGDIVVSKNWSSPVEIVDINWALGAAAVELSDGCIVVWPIANLTRF